MNNTLVLFGNLIILLLLVSCAQLSRPIIQQDAAHDESCPDLSDMQFSFKGTGPPMDGYSVLLPIHPTPTIDLEYTGMIKLFTEDGITAICHKGAEKGENTNYIYCGALRHLHNGIYLITKDNQGNILNKRTVTIIFDLRTKNYVGTQCDKYTI